MYDKYHFGVLHSKLKISMYQRLTILFLSCTFALSAQNLSVKTATIFKNGRSLLTKNGTVSPTDGRYRTTELPNALFGTFWVTAPDLQSVFTGIDSVDSGPQGDERDFILLEQATFFRQNTGKNVRIWLNNGSSSAPTPMDGTFETIEGLPKTGAFHVLTFKTNTGKWLTISPYEIHHFEFSERPNYNPAATNFKKAVRRLDLIFNSKKDKQNVEMTYLTNNLGWVPVYRLDLLDKNKAHLSLRAEIVNDAEDLGDAELRLAVGIPNFTYANKLSDLMNFDLQASNRYGSDNAAWSIGLSNASQQVVFSPETYEERIVIVGEDNTTGSQAEDFYFYTIHPGNFPKNSRYQYPIFEADVVPVHYYDCTIRSATADSYRNYQQQAGKKEEKNDVFHFVEFTNPSKFPYTTGAVNISSQSTAGLQPISQDMLPYTPATAKCKVKIAQTPEIRITHAEGDIEREENAKRFFSNTYDRIKIEGQLCVVNYKSEPVTVKVHRNIDGTPLQSEQMWKTTQEQATLRINPAFVAEWEITLKPGEEKKWKYTYEVFVNF
jgi:Domain of unknown function (DUF4139)